MPEPDLSSKPLQASLGSQAAGSPGVQTLRLAAICLGLVVLVLLGFLPALHNGFVNYDDNVYVTENPQVQAGLTRESLAWAFGKLHGEQTYWHPLTWVSHMLDCQLYGLRPWGHHLTSVVWHAVNALLVFLVFTRMTGAVWRCAVLAALFALHPLQVDTVAWVTERKNLLSTFFFLLAVWAYAGYAQGKTRAERGGLRTVSAGPILRARHPTLDYMLAVVFFALGLMCKPAVVTLPFVLLLLDYWPLCRFSPSSLMPHPSSPGQLPALWHLVWEKAPLILLAAASSGITLAAHRALGMFAAGSELPWGLRIENALVSYCRYLGKVGYPLRLCVLYPHPQKWPLLSVLLASLLLLGLSVLALTQWKRRPYLPVGWFWFLGTLVPVIGLVQVGGQAMADRFMYVPLLGLLLLLIWGAHDLTCLWRYQTVALTAAGAAAILVCLTLTRNQIAYWKDSESLFRHAIATTENNCIAHYNLGDALLKRGQVDEAITHFQKALQIRPDFAAAHNNLGNVLLEKGQVDEAIAHFQKALEVRPLFAAARSNLGGALLQKGQTEAAITQFQQALDLDPNNPRPRYNLGSAFLESGRVDEAIDQFQEALKLNPRFAQAHYNLGNALLQRGQVDEARLQFEKELQIQPGFADAHNNLGNLLLQKGQVDEAIAHFQKALGLRPLFADARSNLGGALLQQGHPGEAVVQFQKALEITPNDPVTRYNLGSALLKSGRVDEAITQFQGVLDIRSDFPEACSKLGSALLQNGRVDEALAQFRRAVQLNPSLANVQSDLGTLLLQKGWVDEAVAHYQAALALQPANALFLNNLAWVLATCPVASIRNGAKAVELAQQAERITKAGNPAILGTLGAAYAEAGRFPEALRTAQHALELATAQTNAAQAEMLRANIALFQAGSPFHEAGQTNGSRNLNHP